MKVGAENRKKLIAAIVLMVLAVFGVYSLLSRPKTPAAAPAAAPATASARRPATRRGASRGTAPAGENLDPTLRLDLLRASEGMKYEGTGRNIFRGEGGGELPKPAANPLKDAAAKPAPPVPTGPPPPPPINLKFYGFANRPGDPAKKVFLSEGDNIFIAGEGEVVNRRYKVVKIGQSSVEIEDLLYNNKRTIPLTQS